MTERYICIHGHFYQPPRENPWLEDVEIQDSAYPYHDWNERINAECYARNTASRILDPEKKVVDLINNYSRMSFNFGPTLLSWMERNKPKTYQAILEADQLSMERFSGHGSAMAQAYNHMIMPLANRRDKVTQIRWGIRDFEKRFGRFPEGMWLPETAVDMETLEIMAEFGIKFTLLAPRQAKRVRRIKKGSKWHDVSEGKIDPTMAYLCLLPSNKTINLFFYDGPISQDIAFGGLLENGEHFAHRLLSAFHDAREWPQLVHIATDGESYGHHHRFGEMALAFCLHFIESQSLAKITNYGEYLEKHPPTRWVEIFDHSSWSCIHGGERWKENCGCHSGMHPGWNQEWRRPLREAMDWLRDQLVPLYEGKGKEHLKNPWEAREDYIEVILNRSAEQVEKFFEKNALRELSREEKKEVLKLLEIQKNAMLMYTSCGWFFDEISGIETTQVMRYAARAIQLGEEVLGAFLEKEYLQALEKAPSNIPEFENGAKIYEMFMKPTALDLLRVGAHYAISSLFEEYPESIRIYCFVAESEVYERMEAGKFRLAIGKTRILSEITWDEEMISFAVLHLGDHSLNGGVRRFMGEEAFSSMYGEVKGAFNKGEIPDVIRLMDKHFGMNNYSLWHLFKDEQKKVLDQVLRSTLEGVEISFRKMYEKNYPIMSFLQSLQMPLPKPLMVAAEYIVNMDLKRAFEGEDLDTGKLEGLINEAKKWSLEIDKRTIGFVASKWMDAFMEKVKQHPEEIPSYEKVGKVLGLLSSLSAEPDLWKTQNIYFSIGKQHYGPMKQKVEAGDDLARRWVEVFGQLGSRLHVKVS
ncbi:MAG: glycoside hydrolase [Deltaproteobacteria bacterium RBG_19FT_COMBO_46_12]|nr:MAG: glycoside hydrolase [Deltaproteobacteria bacterium RBG_19FT_COMBO_46_12]